MSILSINLEYVTDWQGRTVLWNIFQNWHVYIWVSLGPPDRRMVSLILDALEALTDIYHAIL